MGIERMHEAGSAKEAAGKIIETRARHAKVRLGKMRGDKTRFLALVAEFLKGSGFEKTRIDIVQVDVLARCACGFRGVINIPEHVHFVRCPKCKKIADVLEGNELDIEIIE